MAHKKDRGAFDTAKRTRPFDANRLPANGWRDEENGGEKPPPAPIGSEVPTDFVGADLKNVEHNASNDAQRRTSDFYYIIIINIVNCT